MLAGSATLALDGPRAPAAARAIITTLLVGHHRHYPQVPRPWPGCLLIPTATATRLDLPADLLSARPHTTGTDTAATVLDQLETEALRRRRALADTDTTNLPAIRDAIPDDTFPTVLAVLDQDPDPQHAHRLPTGDGSLGIHLLALGTAPDAVYLDVDGHQADTDPPVLWPQLAADEATDLIRLTTAAHDLPAQPPPPTTPAVPSDERHPEADRRTTTASNGTGPRPAAITTLAPPPAPARATDVAPAPPPSTAPEPASSPQPAASAPAADVRVRLRLFGRPALSIDGEPRTSGLLARSLEVAAYLAVHRGGISGDQLVADLLPDRPPTKARNLIYQAIAQLRAALRAATGHDGTHYLPGDKKTGYRLDPDHFAVDLWDFLGALTDAGHAHGDDTRSAALDRAVALVTGPLFGDAPYEWAATPVADTEHRALAALAALADLHADTQPDRASPTWKPRSTSHPTSKRSTSTPCASTPPPDDPTPSASPTVDSPTPSNPSASTHF